MVLGKFRKAQRDAIQSDRKLSELTRACEAFEKEVDKLQARCSKLEKAESELERWEKREPAIKHYLGVVSAMAAENDILKEQLICLGYAVPKTNYAMKLANDSHLQEVAEQEGHVDTGMPLDDGGMGRSKGVSNGQSATDDRRARGQHSNGYSSDRTLSGPATNSRIRSDAAATQDDIHSSGRKRKRAEYMESRADNQLEIVPNNRTSSSDLMPPPAFPLLRRPPDRAEPTDGGRTTQAAHNRPQSSHEDRPTMERLNNPRLQVYEGGDWHSLKGKERIELSDERAHALYTAKRAHPYLVDGAQRATLSHLDKETEGSNREPRGVSGSFKPPVQVRSIERGRDERSDLPFLQPLERSDRNMRPHVESRHLQDLRPFADNVVNERRFKRPIAHSSDRYIDSNVQAYGPTLQPFNEPAVHRQPVARPSTEAFRDAANHAAAAHAYPTPSSRMYPARERLVVNPRTPSPRRQFEPNVLVRGEPVASPFFRTNGDRIWNHHSRYISHERSSVKPTTEHDIMQGYRMAPAATHWNEPRSLNGLSFIDEPHTHSGQPLYQHERLSTVATNARQPLLVPHKSRNKHGLFRRPDAPPTSAYAARHAPPASRHGRSYARQAASLPSAVPSVPLSLRPPRSARTFTRGDALATIRGARSSQTALPHRGPHDSYGQSESFIRRDHYAASKGLFSSAGGRRSVRR